jgi:hypothetical protein
LRASASASLPLLCNSNPCWSVCTAIDIDIDGGADSGPEAKFETGAGFSDTDRAARR